MQIHGTGHIHGAQPINAPHRAQGVAPAPAQAPGVADTGSNPIDHGDRLELSHADQADLDATRFVEQARELPDIRADRVAQIRREIESGAYATDDKLDFALERLLDELE